MEIWITISFTTASKIIKHQGINLTSKVKDLYSGNYKTFPTEGEDLKYWTDIHIHGLKDCVSKDFRRNTTREVPRSAVSMLEMPETSGVVLF